MPTHLGISEEWYRAGELPPVRNRPYFVHVGNIKPYKNLSRLVDAFLQVRGRIPHDLVIVGQSDGLITGESQDFFERVRTESQRIHLTGFVSHKELLSLVGHAHALIMPSLYEGFGLPPVGAMAAGVPVVVSRAASLPEICGDAALYFDPSGSGRYSRQADHNRLSCRIEQSAQRVGPGAQHAVHLGFMRAEDFRCSVRESGKQSLLTVDCGDASQCISKLQVYDPRAFVIAPSE